MKVVFDNTTRKFEVREIIPGTAFIFRAYPRVPYLRTDKGYVSLTNGTTFDLENPSAVHLEAVPLHEATVNC